MNRRRIMFEKKYIVILTCFVAIMYFGLAFYLRHCNLEKYSRANKYMVEKSYSEAAEIFEELGDFKNSENLAKEAREKEEEQKKEDTNIPMQFLVLVVCAVMLYFGAKLLVDNGILIAEELHVPERVIAVTFIALGTSLPELVTSIMSIVKGYGNVGLGNVIGANILNLLLVIGIPASITGMSLADQTIRMDAPVSTAVMLILTIPLFVKKRAYRWQGILLLCVYVVYCGASYFLA